MEALLLIIPQLNCVGELYFTNRNIPARSTSSTTDLLRARKHYLNVYSTILPHETQNSHRIKTLPF